MVIEFWLAVKPKGIIVGNLPKYCHRAVSGYRKIGLMEGV